MMKFFIKNTFVYLTLFYTFNIYATDYNDDLKKVDFYVPGILANEAASTVNFLLCFVENTNFGTFVDAGPFKALVDEAKCESASGIDTANESKNATPKSGNSSGGDVNTTDQVEYTPGLYQIVRNTDGTLNGKGWVDIDIGNEGDSMPLKVYLSMKVDEDASENNRFGTFTMRYDLRTPQIISDHPEFGDLPAGFSFQKGYLNVNNSNINFIESSPMGPPRSITADLTSANNQQGFIQSVMRFESGAMYSVKHKIQINSESNKYCQKFDSAQQYTISGNPPSLSAGGGVSETDLNDLITTEINADRQIMTDGGTARTMTGENCWDLRKSKAKRVIYEYGTYNATTESKVDLETPSMSLQANTSENSLAKPIWAHAGYWGVHVNRLDRSNVADNIIFRNKRNNSNASYSLKKDYLSITKKAIQYKALNSLGGTTFQLYVKGIRDETAWATKLANLNFPNSGNCDAADGNCPEYSGFISVSGTDVTFHVTHGMDFDSPTRVMPFKLASSFTFKANGQTASWATQMTDGSGDNRDMHFFDPDSGDGYAVPYSAFVTTNSTNNNSKVRTNVRTEIDLKTLEDEMTAEGIRLSENVTSVLCIRECLDSNALNTAIGELKTALDTEANAGALATSPYKDVGNWFKADVFYDGDGSNTKNGSESTILKGSYNSIGGPRTNQVATYTVNTIGGLKYLNDGTNDLTYHSGPTKTFVDSLEGGGKARKYLYKTKPASYSVNNWQHNYGWAFPMTVVLNTSENRTALLCATSGGNARGFNASYKLISSPNTSALESGADKYYCENKLWGGAVSTTYEIRVIQRAGYRLFDNDQQKVVNVSTPENLEFTVPSPENITYNFINTDLSNKKFKLKFEGFGELHRIPGRVVDTCQNPPTVLGKYFEGEWKECYRYIHEFVIPNGTILTNLTPGGGVGNIKVLGLSGDEYLARLPDGTTGSYSKSSADLPPETNLQNLFDGVNAIGTIPGYNGDPHVIHGKTVIPPSS